MAPVTLGVHHREGLRAGFVLWAPSSSILPVKQVLRASRAANTAAWPSSGGRILAKALATDSGYRCRKQEELGEGRGEGGDRGRGIGADHSPTPWCSGRRGVCLTGQDQTAFGSTVSTIQCLPATWMHTNDWPMD